METDGWYIDLTFGLDCDLGAAQMAASDQYEGTRSAYPGAVDTTGLGDAAYFTNSEMTELHVLTGDAFPTVYERTPAMAR